MPASNPTPADLRRILAPIRCFMLDMDGTFYLGDNLIDGSLDFLAALKRTGRTARFLTNNSSKSASVYKKKLEKMGVEIAVSEEDLMEEYNDNLKKSTGVLIHVNADGSEAIVPITDSIEYISGASVLSKTAYPITINDLMRFKINEAFGTHTGEIYYNDGRGILPLSGTFHIRYYSPEGVLTQSSVSGLSIGKMHDIVDGEGRYYHQGLYLNESIILPKAPFGFFPLFSLL